MEGKYFKTFYVYILTNVFLIWYTKLTKTWMSKWQSL